MTAHRLPQGHQDTDRINESIVGIIANPAASKDIRRLVAHGRVVPDWEKVNIVRRVLLGLDAVGVTRVLGMPDSSRLVQRAADDPRLSLRVDMVDMPVFGLPDDTLRASSIMAEVGIGCLVTLGGDGTNRAVVKGLGEDAARVPIVPISTGTNNVFPAPIEGTLAGLAAGAVARGTLDLDRVSVVSKRIEVYVDGELTDIALVDVAVSRERYVGSRAIWDPATLHEVFLTRGEPASVGLASIGARLRPLSLSDPDGFHFRLGPGGCTVLAPVAPGIVSAVPVAEWRSLPPGERVAVGLSPCTIALDGEREFTVRARQRVEVCISPRGPRVVMVEDALREATATGVFTTSTSPDF